MSSFFSITDETDLGIQALQRDEYLSIVINNKFDVVAKIAVRGIKTATFSYVDLNGQKQNSKEEQEIVCYYNVNYQSFIEVDEFYQSRLKTVKQIVANRTPVVSNVGRAVGFYNNNNQNKNLSKKDDVVDTYNMFISGYTDYNDIKLCPEEFLDLYVTMWGEVISETSIIQKVVDYVEKLPKNKFNLEILKDYKEWLKQTLMSDTEMPYGQMNYGKSWSWE
jgi:hypothetical protein